ncbi:MAG: methyltransferase domain-containing protein [Candidatus Pacebacteria bacterium]|nr:methyltransferase domain-containing protein [Candidatus Paceibacterota bacterium]
MSKSCVYKNKQELIRSLIRNTDTVLDVGFLGQGIQADDVRWPHALLIKTAKDVYGVDLSVDRSLFPSESHYQSISAENFSFPGVVFDVIFAGDLIEHLQNPGLFLEACRTHMNATSRLIITTPNCFNLFNITEKISKDEPTVNSDHTCYFNHKTLRTLLSKSNMDVNDIGYVYSLEYSHKESWKKRFLNLIYALVSSVTPKYLETLVIVASVKNDANQTA